jgi:membrane protease subunit (stomatin/prohibitin family)
MLAVLQPEFAALGLALDTLVVENLSLPEELQKLLDERIGMNMIGNMAQYTQFKTAQSIPIAAANEGAGGFAGIGAGLTAGMGMAQQMAGAFQQAMQPQQPPPQAPPPAAPPAAPAAAAGAVAGAAGAAAVAGDTKFCFNCGARILKAAKFCPECGSKQPEA